MRLFSELFRHVDQTQSTNEKVSHIKDFFASASSEDSAWALFYLSGHRLKRLISSRKLLEWCIEITGTPLWLVEECQAAVGDSAETISLLLPEIQTTTDLENKSLADWMDTLILPLKELTEPQQKAQIFTFWSQLKRQEIFLLNKILTGAFRVGVSSLLTLKGLSLALNVSREILSQRVMGNWEPTAAFFDSLKLTEVENRYLNPYPFYLAYPLDGELADLGEPAEWHVEWKWDGIRAQGVHRGGECALWSRGNELISHQFPEILEALKSLPNDLVVDGELLAYKDHLPLPFSALQKRLGRKVVSKAMTEKVPVVFMLYDLLEQEGIDIRPSSLAERKSQLEKLAHLHPKILISPSVSFTQWADISAERLNAKAKETEGLMIKKLNAPYGVGRKKGQWWKYKVDPLTLDAILMYAQAGSGRRANLFTDYTFGVWDEGEIIPIAKAYSGLDQKEIAELDKWIRRHTEEKFGPVRKVKLLHVFEIAFEGIQLSSRHKSGVALRFPRIVRWRKDKPLEECQTLAQIKAEFLHV